MENMQTEESIDLGKLMQIMLERKKVVGGIIAGCTVIALGAALLMPKQYESTTLVQTRSAGKDIGGMAAMAQMMGISIGGGSSSSASPDNYIALMTTRRVLEPIIDDIYGEENKAKPDAAGFAKANLKIENTKKTNLITVTARGRTPEEAQSISKSVVDNFLKLQTENSQQTQSLLVTFLNERIENAKKESDDADKKLAAFSKEHQIYSPDDQAKAAMDQLAAFDKAIGEMQVQQKSAQAQYDVATQNLGEHKAGSLNYKINDNASVQSIRSSIAEKEVELVTLKQKYTEENPYLIAARRSLGELHQLLENEVRAIVNSNVTTINAAQMALLQSQAVAEAEAGAAKASEAAIKAQKEKKEQEIGKLPDDMMNFLQLKSDSEIKQKIYMSLVQQCEQDKIQEAMQSMDIQIIDEANLPDEDKPAVPRKGLMIVVGFVVGCLISFGYGLICCKREGI